MMDHYDISVVTSHPTQKTVGLELPYSLPTVSTAREMGIQHINVGGKPAFKDREYLTASQLHIRFHTLLKERKIGYYVTFSTLNKGLCLGFNQMTF